MHQSKAKHCQCRTRLPAAESTETSEIVERLVDHGQAYDRIHEIRVDMEAAEYARQQRYAVPMLNNVTRARRVPFDTGRR